MKTVYELALRVLASTSCGFIFSQCWKCHHETACDMALIAQDMILRGEY